MDVSGVNNYQDPSLYSTAPGQGQSAGTEAVAEDNGQDKAAIYEKSGETYKVDRKAVKAAIKEAMDQSERIRQLVEKVLNQQANSALKAEGFQWTKAFFEKLEVDEETRAQAAQEVSEDGYFGVKQTSQRILDFAKAISGGDPSKIDLLRDAVQKGFDAAEKQWGDKLPQISYDTLDAVMKGFDEWAKEAKNESA